MGWRSWNGKRSGNNGKTGCGDKLHVKSMIHNTQVKYGLPVARVGDQEIKSTTYYWYEFYPRKADK